LTRIFSVDRRGDEAGYTVFVRFGGAHGARPGSSVVSRTALRLHVYAILASIEAGHPGLVTDEYLNAVTAETSVAAIELCTAGLWERSDRGYLVLESETDRVAYEVHRQLEELSDWCRLTGGHVADDEHPGLCRKCAVRLD
jgi:hypothetical protein